MPSATTRGSTEHDLLHIGAAIPGAPRWRCRLSVPSGGGAGRVQGRVLTLSLLLLLLSRFSHVRLCATPWTAAHQAPPSMS